MKLKPKVQFPGFRRCRRSTGQQEFNEEFNPPDGSGVNRTKIKVKDELTVLSRLATSRKKARV